MKSQSVIVIGCGIVGLTTAVRLAAVGMDVSVVRDAEHDAKCCTLASGAIWGPFLVGSGLRIDEWSLTTLATLRRDALLEESGVTLRFGWAVDPTGDPTTWWVSGFDGAEPAPARPEPSWRVCLPVIDPRRYMGFLMARLVESAVSVQCRHVTSLDDELLNHDWVVLAAGIGSSRLAPDQTLVPVRGELVIADQCGVTDIVSVRGEGPELTYIIPHPDHIVLGGTAVWQSADRSPDPAAETAILERCIAAVPQLKDCRVRQTRVGIRPFRPTVRVEKDEDRNIVYNYGHGGSGVSIAWGTADDTVRLMHASSLTASTARRKLRLVPASVDVDAGLQLIQAMTCEIESLYDDLDFDGPDMPAAGPHELGPPYGEFYIALIDDIPVACGGFKRLDFDCCEIKRMFVRVQYRRLGIARSLLERLESRAFGLGYLRSRLSVGPKQDGARNLYQSIGYREIHNFNNNPVASFFGEKLLAEHAP